MVKHVKLKRSSVKGKAPVPKSDLEYGELALNYNHEAAALFARADDDTLLRFDAGPPADASATVKGIVELATAAETTTGTDAVRAVTPAGLKVELNKKAPLASPALTGTPTAPTATAATSTTQIATTAFVHSLVGGASAAIKAVAPLYYDSSTGSISLDISRLPDISTAP